LQTKSNKSQKATILSHAVIHDDYISSKAENDSQDGGSFVQLTDEMEEDRHLLVTHFRGMLFESRPITIEQKGSLISLMHMKTMRQTLADILMEVGTSVRQIQTFEVLKLIADVIRFVLTLFVHENFDEYRLLYVILDASAHVYCLSQARRKQYLY